MPFAITKVKINSGQGRVSNGELLSKLSTALPSAPGGRLVPVTAESPSETVSGLGPSTLGQR